MISHEKIILEILEKLNISLASSQIKNINEYLNILFQWHDMHNIVSTRDVEYFLRRDFFDSLSASRHMSGNELLDVGTGAGIPGILMALTRNDIKVHLLDRRENAIRFLEHVKLRLKLENINIINQDIEKYKSSLNIEGVVIKNYSNKITAKLPYDRKITYMVKLIRKNFINLPIYFITGASSLLLKKDFIFDVNVTKIETEFFDTNRYILEIKP